MNTKILKVGQVNTWNQGGAAIACQRLHHGLQREGQLSQLIVRTGSKEVNPNSLKIILNRVKKKFDPLPNLKRKNFSKMELFSSPHSQFRIEEHESIINADIVHLHWVSDFLNFGTFFKSVSGPIVWTLHDLNPLMGGLHYTIDVERISADLLKHELKLREYKQSILRKKNLFYVFPSQWLMNEAIRIAPWLKDKQVSVIPNGLDTSINTYREMSEVRKKLNISPDKKVFIFVSENISNYRKGFDIILESFDKDFLESNNIQLMAIGNYPEFRSPHISYVGPINDPKLLSEYYSSADAFLLPSRQDNLPNVMLEALCAGCPVVSFKTGGMLEHIDESNGFLCDLPNAKSLRSGVSQILKRSFDRHAISLAASMKFSLKQSVEKHIELYSNILNDQSQRK